MDYARLGLVALASLAVACSGDGPDPGGVGVAAADAAYVNGSIWTGVENEPRASAIAIADGRILAIGTDTVVREHLVEGTRVVDLGGAFVVPGLIDNHTHFLWGGFSLASVQLRDASSREDLVRRIAEFAAAQPAGRWVREGEWDHEAWGGELPHRDWIDPVTPEHPVLVYRLDGHMALANSLAIKLAGVTAATPDPPGGEIVRDASGEPSGVFRDTAIALVGEAIPPRSAEEYDAALDAAVQHALARGVTQIHDMADPALAWESFAAFRRAHSDGRLGLRVYEFLPIEDWARVAEYVTMYGRGDERLRWGGLKGFVDGSLGSTTAWFYEPYEDAPQTRGLVLQDLDVLKSLLRGADAAGLHVAVHAIGDRANDWLLDAYQGVVAENGAFDSPLPARRFRIEHAQHLSSAAIARFAAQGVIPSMQPYHAIDDGRWAQDRIGAGRIERTYAFASLLDADARLTFGSDWTVAPLNPLAGIYAAVTRRTRDGANPEGWVPAQKISVEQALRAYTSANAYAGFQEDMLGTLEAGKLADFVVLSEDLFAIDPTGIRDVRVLRTVVDGEDRYPRSD